MKYMADAITTEYFQLDYYAKGVLAQPVKLRGTMWNYPNEGLMDNSKKRV